MIDIEAIRQRNEERKRRLFSALARKTAIVLGDPRKAASTCDDIDALLAEVDRLRHKAGECACDPEAPKYGYDEVVCMYALAQRNNAAAQIPGFTCGAAKV